MSDNQPAKSFRIGFVTATIWQNDGLERSFYSVELTRTYKDDDGRYRSTNALNHGDLMNGVRVLQKAESWIADQLAT